MTCSPLTHLGEISVEQFLSEYWQKKPLLVRKALPNLAELIDADELGGLSLEDDVQSRLVIQDGNDWKVEHGPLAEDRFSTLPESHWSLLVQNVDALSLEINDLLKRFRFLPNWRLDDIMVSFASDQGGVGPHFDYYDVFLLQGEGKRRWKIGQGCDSTSTLVEGLPMKILEHFECNEEYILEEGDLLYIPANIAHWGESIGESICYSVGFRAPAHSEFLLEYTQDIWESLSEDDRFRDGSEITNTKLSGEIQPEVIDAFRSVLLDLADRPSQIAHWIAEFSTQLKQGIEPELLPLEFANIDDFLSEQPMVMSHFNRCAFYKTDDDKAHCFINGTGYELSIAFAQVLCDYKVFSINDVPLSDHEAAKALIEERKIIRA